MNKLFLLLFLLLNLHAYELAKSYEYEKNIIYSNDLFPALSQKFEILKIPSDQDHYRLDAQVIAKTFELNGIPIVVSEPSPGGTSVCNINNQEIECQTGNPIDITKDNIPEPFCLRSGEKTEIRFRVKIE